MRFHRFLAPESLIKDEFDIISFHWEQVKVQAPRLGTRPFRIVPHDIKELRYLEGADLDRQNDSQRLLVRRVSHHRRVIISAALALDSSWPQTRRHVSWD